MKILVMHPGTQHSTKLASAIKESGHDVKLLTTVYNKKHTIINFVKNLLPKKEIKRLDARKNNNLNDNDIIVKCELEGIILLLLGRIDRSKKIYAKYKYHVAKKIAKKAYKIIIKENYDVVITFDSYAYHLFKRLKETKINIVKIIDYTAAYPIFVKKIYEKLFIQYPNFKSSLKSERCILWNKKYCKAAAEEIYYADKFITASSYTSKTLIEYGIENKNIIKIPYGYDAINKKHNKSEKDIDKTEFNILYVGNVNIMKGVTNLINAFQKIKYNEIKLRLVGNVQNIIYDIVKDNRINILGFIPQNLLYKEYNNCDLFVFPSLSDGFGFAPLEAMSFGKACIVTEEAGISDIIENGKDGFVIPANNQEALKEKIEWCFHNKNIIKEMGKRAEKKVYNYSNESYRMKISELLKIIERERNHEK